MNLALISDNGILPRSFRACSASSLRYWSNCSTDVHGLHSLTKKLVESRIGGDSQ